MNGAQSISELYNWAYLLIGAFISVMLSVIVFFLRQTLVDLKMQAREQGEKIAEHETRITVLEKLPA